MTEIPYISEEVADTIADAVEMWLDAENEEFEDGDLVEYIRGLATDSGSGWSLGWS